MALNRWPVGARKDSEGDKRWRNGVTDGTRTHDDQNHNLGLYQLSYGHHVWPAGRELNPRPTA